MGTEECLFLSIMKILKWITSHLTNKNKQINKKQKPSQTNGKFADSAIIRQKNRLCVRVLATHTNTAFVW